MYDKRKTTAETICVFKRYCWKSEMISHHTERQVSYEEDFIITHYVMPDRKYFNDPGSSKDEDH